MNSSGYRIAAALVAVACLSALFAGDLQATPPSAGSVFIEFRTSGPEDPAPALIVGARAAWPFVLGELRVFLPPMGNAPGDTLLLWSGAGPLKDTLRFENLLPKLPLGQYRFIAVLTFPKNTYGMNAAGNSLYVEISEDTVRTSTIGFDRFERAKISEELVRRGLKDASGDEIARQAPDLIHRLSKLGLGFVSPRLDSARAKGIKSVPSTPSPTTDPPARRNMGTRPFRVLSSEDSAHYRERENARRAAQRRRSDSLAASGIPYIDTTTITRERRPRTDRPTRPTTLSPRARIYTGEAAKQLLESRARSLKRQQAEEAQRADSLKSENPK